MSKAMLMRWSFIVLIAALVGVISGYRLTVSVIAHSLDLAQIVGVFAGLGLTAISIMAALPLDSWILRARKKNHQIAKGLIAQLKNLPTQFKKYLFTQISAIAALALLGLTSDDLLETVKPNPPPATPIILEWYWGWIIGLASSVIAGLTAFCCFAAWDTFILLHKISEKSIERYNDLGLNEDAPVSSLISKPHPGPEEISAEVVREDETPGK